MKFRPAIATNGNECDRPTFFRRRCVMFPDGFDDLIYKPGMSSDDIL